MEWEELMTSKRKGEENAEIRMELKYCERCGGLWIREGGAGVYCDRCRSKVADLPIPKKKPGRVSLPVGKKTLVERYAPTTSEKKTLSFGASAGGVA